MRWSYALLVSAVLLAGCPGGDECESAAECNDNNACTDDVCSAGACSNNEVTNLDDNDACTVDACDPATGVTHEPIPGIDDNDACTADACDPATGTITHDPVDLDDNNACTEDACDPLTGDVTHDPVNVNDNNACTEDACDPLTGDVSNTPIDLDDGDACTLDACDPVTGVSHTPVNVNDNNVCTEDACDPLTGDVSNTPIDLDDNNACTIDACDPVAGVTHEPVAIDDNNACTTDACDPLTGTITHDPVSTDDGVGCTEDACDPATGTVTHTPDDTVCADVDGASCSIPRCDIALDCVEDLADNLCADGQACTTADLCDPSDPGADAATGCAFTLDNASCGDGVGCTEDACVPFAGCENTPYDGNCANGEVCDPVQDCQEVAGALAQAVVSEFSAIGAAGNAGEFVELFNPGLAGDLRGGVILNGLGQTAVIRAASDPTGAGNTPVLVASNTFVFGVPNPANAADIPAGAAFVYGEPGTAFALADTGDILTVQNSDAATLDVVDFSSFATNPDALVPAGAFPGFGGVSTQLDPTRLSASDNDSGDNWCTTFRLFDTAGEDNLSCAPTAVVINELVYDGALGADTGDASKTFIELAGPGGARIADLRVRLVETDGATAGQLDGPNILIGAQLANARMPVDGLFVIADNTNGPSVTVPANARDLQIAFDPENNTQAVQLLLDLGGALSSVDALAYVVNAATDLDATVDIVNGLPIVEGTPALDTAQGISLSRNLVSEDTNNNSVDFVLDPSPSPGVQNQAPHTTITSITPDDGLVGVTTPVTIVGTDLGFNGVISFAGTAVPTANCNFNGTPTTVTCNVPAGAAVGRGDVVYTNTADRGGDSFTLVNGWTYTGVLNETDQAAELDFCNLQFPASYTAAVNTPSPLLFGQIFEAGLTEGAGGFSSTVFAEAGFGPAAANPTTTAGWLFFTAQPNVEVGNNDEYAATLTIPTAGTFSYTFRFSFDGGLNFTYCDLNGAGSNGGLTFEANQLGTATIQ